MTLFGGNSVTPGWGGYTYPIPTVVRVQIQTRVNPELCTLEEAYKFLGCVLAQGDIIPAGQMPLIYEENENELFVDPAYTAAGYLPFILTWDAQMPSPGARDIPEPGNPEPAPAPGQYTYAVNIGLMYASAPRLPGATGASGPQAFRSDMKLQVKADGSLSWVGLDQPTWQGVVSTGNPSA